MARASTYTVTPLDTYAKVMGINPIHFNGGTDNNIPLIPQAEGCRDIWHQYPWQSRTRVSIEELARVMANVERRIAAELRYWPAPVYTEDEENDYTSFYRPEYAGTTASALNGSFKSIPLNKERFIAGGKRAVELIEAGATVSYADPNSDGWDAVATITSLTAITELTELRLFFAGKSGEPEWEIRPLTTKTADGTTFTATLPAWLLLDPDILDDWPGEQYDSGLDIETATNFVETVDVYRVYTDPEEQCTLLWGGRHAGITKTQGGYLLGRKPKLGFVSPVAATYDSGSFTEVALSNYFEPDYVIASYLSGLAQVRNGQYIIPPLLEEAIVYMTTARLEKPVCSTCPVPQAREMELKQDLVIAQTRKQEGEEVKFVRRDVLTTPFGSRKGEVEAWRIVHSLKQEETLGFALI